jgi:type IV secretion system protein VirB8
VGELNRPLPIDSTVLEKRVNQMKLQKSDSTKAAGKVVSRAPQSFEEAAKDFEESKIIGLKTSRKIAWIVAGSAVGLAFLCIIAVLVALFNHDDPQPVILTHDTSTGDVTMARSIKDSQDKYDEVTDRYWIATYVRNRENYDWYTIGTDSEIIKLMSAPDVAAEYMREIQAPSAPLNVYKDKGKVVTKVTSITFVGNVAQVRFTKERVTTSGENLDGSPVQTFIATISYKYESGLMTDQQRLINPLGFKSLTYRRDEEVVK